MRIARSRPPFSGTPGAFRLFNEQLAGQIAWLLPAAIAAILILVILCTNRAVVVLLGSWLLTMVAMSSAVAGTHQFYTSALAIPIAVLVAAPYITATGDNVLPIGGFDGQDPTPTLAAFQDLVRQGQLRFVLAGVIPETGGQIGDWVGANCSKVTYSTAPSTALYDCAAK